MNTPKRLSEVVNRKTDNTIAKRITTRTNNVPHSLRITGFVTRVTRRVPIFEHELPILPEHLNSRPVFSGVRGERSFPFFSVQCLAGRCLSFCPVLFCHFSTLIDHEHFEGSIYVKLDVKICSFAILTKQLIYVINMF